MSRTLQRLKTPCHCGWKFVGFHLCTPPEKMEEARVVHPIKKTNSSKEKADKQAEKKPGNRVGRPREKFPEDVQRAKQREYQRKYKAKKRAEKLAEREANPVVTLCGEANCKSPAQGRSKFCETHKAVRARQRSLASYHRRKARAAANSGKVA